jgi:formiminotetrahydrofolate cyclodeaminase
MLHSINELREHQPPSPGGGANAAMATTPIYHTLALLHTVIGEHEKVKHDLVDGK